MYKKAVPVLLACALALAAAPLWAAPEAVAGAGAGDAAEAAVAYSNALALANTARAWNLLSSHSRQGITEAQWAESFGQRQAMPKPSAAQVLGPLAGAAGTPTVSGVLVRGDESLVDVTGTVEIAQTVVLVREADGWRVDLADTDQANAREAAQTFLDAVREQQAANPSAQGRRSNDASLPLLRMLLRPEAKNFRALKSDVSGNRATVTVGADLPVSLVLRTTRSGAGWTVDLTRPLAQVDILAPDPLKEAAAASDRQACEDELRRIGAAIQMYASTSDDMLPDPKRWVTQISRISPQLGNLHCATDPTPGVSYAYNSDLAGKRRRDIGNPSLVPMVFESSAHRPNAADAGASWPAKPWHEGVMVLYADGSVRLTTVKPSFAVPPAPPGGAFRPGMAGRPMMRPGGPGMPGPMGGPGAGMMRPVPAGPR